MNDINLALTVNTIFWVCLFLIVYVPMAERDSYYTAAKDSLKDDPPMRWRKALIDAEAERAKEAIR